MNRYEIIAQQSIEDSHIITWAQGYSYTTHMPTCTDLIHTHSVTHTHTHTHIALPDKKQISFLKWVLEGCVVIVYNEDDVEEPHWFQIHSHVISLYCHNYGCLQFLWHTLNACGYELEYFHESNSSLFLSCGLYASLHS